MSDAQAMRYSLICLFVLLTSLSATTQAEDVMAVSHPRVKDRIALMRSAHHALSELVDMAAGRLMFDKKQAKTNRRTLIKATRKIPDRFRNNPSDPASNARAKIWDNWGGFKTHASIANQKAKLINTKNLGKLRQSLQPMMHACLSCHKTYRKPP